MASTETVSTLTPSTGSTLASKKNKPGSTSVSITTTNNNNNNNNNSGPEGTDNECDEEITTK